MIPVQGPEEKHICLGGSNQGDLHLPVKQDEVGSIPTPPAKTMTEITFVANIAGIKTTVDGGVNLTLSIPETDTETIKKLFDSRSKNLHVGIVTEPEL